MGMLIRAGYPFIAKTYFYQQFIVPNQAGWGTGFRLDDNSPQIKGNAAQAGNLGSGAGTTGYWGTYKADGYNGGPGVGGKFNTDDQYATAFLTPPDFGSTDNLAANMRFGLYLRGGDTFKGSGNTMVLLTVTKSNGCTILSYNGTTQTQRASSSTTIAANSFITFKAEGNLYAGYLGSSTTPFISWTDSTGITQRGPNNRRWGMYQEANFPIFQRQWASYATSQLEAGDL